MVYTNSCNVYLILAEATANKKEEYEGISITSLVTHYRVAIASRFWKKLVWSEKRSIGTYRVQIHCFPQAAKMLFPMLEKQNELKITDLEIMRRAFVDICALSRDYLPHPPDSCTSEICRLHCNRVCIEPPMKVKLNTNSHLVFTFKIARYKANGELY